ncbi:phage tail tape measure protein [Arsenicibacter rosenii]|uniref:Phage tail tape measure protein n=1 Tax=Arsenicibacter rosenii TaxID=1750698 RepID=A0A1S2VRP5_9BACT|nr:phage tail tape measure protein [Arsenicibacter rosenii]OIN61160.1 phage tail tape measure protein [Arsenicibacter rosenii]
MGQLDESVKLRTEIDTDEASVSLEGLKSELREVKGELREMGQVSDEWTDEQKEAYTELRRRQADLTDEIKEYTRSIDLNDASLNELRASSRLLHQELNQLKIGSEEWLEKMEQVKDVDGKIADVRQEMRNLNDAVDQQSSLWGQLKDDFLSTFAAIQLDDVIDAVVDFGKESVEAAAKQSDAFADIRKATGMTTEEVEGLNETLKNLDTRSSQEALLDIAQVGGQIGIATDEMRGFVEMTDKANVALGDEFSGGAEEVASKMGTLSQLFKETKDLNAGEAINQIGSAMNELGAAGSATAPVVAEFTTRIGQLGNLAPQISETMGLGAAMQELGLSAEIAAGGITNIMLTGANEIDAFAKQMGMAKSEVQGLINTNPNEFLLKLAESFKGLSNTQVAQRLAEMKVGSQESIKVMSLLASQTDVVRDKQQLAAKAMAEGTSLTNEFNLKNQTAAAELEKAKKQVENFKTELGVGLMPVVTTTVSGLVLFLNAIRNIPQFVTENKTAIGLLALGLVTLNANMIQAQVTTLAKVAADKAAAAASTLAAAADQVRAQRTAATTTAETAAGAATKSRTLQETLANAQTTISNGLTQAKVVLTNAWTVAQNALNTALKANPIGIVITAIAALAAGLVIAYEKSETFRGIVNGVWAALKVLWDMLSPVQDAFSGLFSLLQRGVALWLNLQQAVVGFAAGALQAILGAFYEPAKNAIMSLWNAIADFGNKLLEFGGKIAAFLGLDDVAAKARAAGEKMGTAFKEAYDKELTAARTKDAADHDAHVTKKTSADSAAALKSAQAMLNANKDALSGMGSDNDGHRTKEQQKEAEHAKKVAEEKKKANVDAVNDIRSRNIELIADEQTRKLAQLEFERDKERARITESKADHALKTRQMQLVEKQYEADVAAVQKDFRDKKAAEEKAAMEKYLADQEARKQKEKQLFDELIQYEQATNKTNSEFQLNLTTLTESQKLNLRKQQLQQSYNETAAAINKEYADKVKEIQDNVRDNDERMKAIKTLNEWKNSQLSAADQKHTQDMTALNQEHLEKRRANTKEFFDGINGLMNGDYTAFMGFLNKKLANDKAANNQKLQDFTQKGTETLEVAGQVVQSLQQLNQKFLDSQLKKIQKEKDTQVKSWEDQYKAGKISKEQFDKEVDKINQDSAAKEKEAKLTAWKRDQKLQIAMALINAAMAALKSLATMGFPLGLIGVAASAAMAAIQIGIIKSQKPPDFARGGFVNGGVPVGPRHGSRYGESGLAIVERNPDGTYGEEKGEMEGGEPVMILSRNTYANNRPIIDRLLHSSLHRNGAPIYKAGGIVGSDGGSYRDYLEPLRKGKMYLFGSKKKREAEEAAAAAQAEADAAMSDMGGDYSGDDGGYSSTTAGSADDTVSMTNEEIGKSQKLMEGIETNTADTVDKLGNANFALGAISIKLDTANGYLAQIAAKNLNVSVTNIINIQNNIEAVNRDSNL